jgi:23S rRNA (cytosine1962-C5)-methyltransferase
MKVDYPKNWVDYQLIDSGDFEKLERFGEYITIRPEPQAVWNKTMTMKQWEQEADVKFVAKSSSQGTWHKLNKNMPDQWVVEYEHKGLKIKMRLGLTSFKHVGIFPEQAANWDFIYEKIKELKTSEPSVLNMFAYTGGASLAAKAAGADTTHLDSIKQVVTWSKQNMEISGLDNIRWMVEDALKFAKRAAKRGAKYNGIILDPPAYGHGPKGENWKLERDIGEMMECVLQMLDPDDHFIVLNTYSLGFSAIILENILRKLGYKGNIEIGELSLKAREDHSLPLGVYARCTSK